MFSWYIKHHLSEVRASVKLEGNLTMLSLLTAFLQRDTSCYCVWSARHFYILSNLCTFTLRVMFVETIHLVDYYKLTWFWIHSFIYREFWFLSTYGWIWRYFRRLYVISKRREKHFVKYSRNLNVFNSKQNISSVRKAKCIQHWKLFMNMALS